MSPRTFRAVSPMLMYLSPTPHLPCRRHWYRAPPYRIPFVDTSVVIPIHFDAEQQAIPIILPLVGLAIFVVVEAPYLLGCAANEPVTSSTHPSMARYGLCRNEKRMDQDAHRLRHVIAPEHPTSRSEPTYDSRCHRLVRSLASCPGGSGDRWLAGI